MRLAALAFVGALGLTFASVSANAAPLIPNLNTDQVSNIVEVAGGCRRGFHPTRSGRCVPHRYSYAQPRQYSYAYPHQHWRGNYGGGYYARGWRSPSDSVANLLNRNEMGRIHSGSSMPHRGHGWGY